MVATRRGARTGAGDVTSDQSTTLALRKKPVRKAATKSTTTAPPKPAPKSRTTRSKKLEDVAKDGQDEHVEEAEDLPNDDASPPRTRRAVTRTEKANTAAAEVAATKRIVPKAATKTTRATNARSKRPEIHHDQVPQIQPEVKARSTRTTRAKAAMENAKILSPKKVTQVSKGPLRATKSSAAKVASKPVLQKTAGATRSTRRRAVSDENAEIPDLRKVGDFEESDGDEIAIHTSKQKPSLKPKSIPVIEIESDVDMSSRPTTPTSSPKSDSGRVEDNSVDDQEQESDPEDRESDSESSAESADELCGPKTPMRRCSPREAARFSGSPSRSPRHDHEEHHIQTPVRFNIFPGGRRGIPQTQRPHIQTSLSSFDRESMTIARASSRAMVFPELKPLPVALATRIKRSFEPRIEEDSEPSLGSVGGNRDSLVREPELPSLPSHTVQEFEHVDDEVPTYSDSDELQGDRSSPSDGRADMMDVPGIEIADTKYGFEFDAMPSSDAKGAGTEMFEDDDSVIIASNRRALEQVSPIKSFEKRLLEANASTPKPETLIWENIRQDETLIIDCLPGDVTPDSLPEPDQTEILSPTASFASLEQNEQHTPWPQVLSASPDVSQSTQKRSRASIASNRPSLDATIHLSQFIDVQSLSENEHDSALHASNDLNMDMDLEMNDTDVHQSTPIRTARACDQIEVVAEPGTPRYAQPTMASAVKRRQSLPAISFSTPFKATARPKTSDGASLPRLTFTQLPQYSQIEDPFMTTTPKAGPPQPRLVDRAQTSIDTDMTAKSATPQLKASQPRTPSATSPRRRQVKTTNVPVPQTIAADRYRARISFGSGKAFRVDPSNPSSAISTVKTARIANKERYPGLPSRDTYEELAATPATEKPSDQMPQTPETVTARRLVPSPQRTTTRTVTWTPTVRTKVRSVTPSPLSSRKERFPGLPSRRTYEEHAKTAVVPTRFRTVSHVPAKRPASAMKASSIRDLARNSGTPIKTPLKPPGMTPGQIPMTPHPAAPLRDVYALVDVWTNDASPASSAFITLLQRLGARTTKSWSKRLTHVVFKSGSPTTLQRVRLHNKEVGESGVGSPVFCVNSRWVTDCDTEGRRMDETDEEYIVDIEEACRGSKRRRKSMEPAALMNIGGNVIRDRKSSLGRASIGRSPLKNVFAPERDQNTPPFDSAARDNDDRQDDSSPVTPAYLAAPNLLVQQTAPMNRVRKLALGSKGQGKDRRTTVWNLEF